MDSRPSIALRALAHPVAVMSLIVLIVNDHLLKQAWPGFVTGKLSDLSGLIVAPLLLTVALSVLRVPRAIVIASASTAVGFAAVKLSPAAAEQVSSWWGVGGFETRMLADSTDLIALPAVAVAFHLYRQTATRPVPNVRRFTSLAIGAALLPFVVLATAATSCQEDAQVRYVHSVEGRFSDSPAERAERAMVIRGNQFVYLTADGVGESMTYEDTKRLEAADGNIYTSDQAACDETGTCWRVDFPAVDISLDSGRTWSTDYVMSESDVDEALDGAVEACGHDASANFSGIAILPAGYSDRVAVTARDAGLLLRSADGKWRRVPESEIEDAGYPERGDTATLHSPIVEVPPRLPAVR